MNLDFYNMIVPGIIEGFLAIATILLPLIIWMLLPAIILWIFSKSKVAWNIGLILGLIGYFTIGPFSNNNLF